MVAFHVRASGEKTLGDELAGYKRVPTAKLRPWPFGTGQAPPPRFAGATEGRGLRTYSTSTEYALPLLRRLRTTLKYKTLPLSLILRASDLPEPKRTRPVAEATSSSSAG